MELPKTRPLKIFAYDPTLGRSANNRVSVEIAYEAVDPGPTGSRVQVIDYDASNDVFYQPVDLDQDEILIQGGLNPSISDPRFHQQMVYGVVCKVLENFDRALGRRITFRGRKRLLVFPHAFQRANAFYDSKTTSLMFGYFSSDRARPGFTKPGQTIFTCLSHDIVSHECTHAIVDRLRPYFNEWTNLDLPALHEGFADIVAIFQHFSFPGVLRNHIQQTRGDLKTQSALIELAEEFGHATGSGGALRSAIDHPDPMLYQTAVEPHQRGSILVAAVFEGFHKTYQTRIHDLLRIATGGTGILPQGALPPTLVDMIAREAERTAQNILTMTIRAFEYMPPVDATFGDYLRALVTADFEIDPMDADCKRANMVEAFRTRGIYPEEVDSLLEESLLLERIEDAPRLPIKDLEYLIVTAARDWSTTTVRKAQESEEYLGDATKEKDLDTLYGKLSDVELADDDADQFEGNAAASLNAFARECSRQGLLPFNQNLKIRVLGFHPVFRVAPHGQLLIEMVAQFSQTLKEQGNFLDTGGVPLRAGATVIASADGTIRYIIKKPFPIRNSTNVLEQRRFERQLEFQRVFDLLSVEQAWGTDKESSLEYRNRILNKMNFSMMHRGLFS